jgi:ABC-type sugar transport system substrate-binding protein
MLAKADVIRAYEAASQAGAHRATSRFSPAIDSLRPATAVQYFDLLRWRTLGHFMAVAARALDLELEVVYAERDHLLMLRQADELARRATAPDYVVIVNEKMAGRQMLEALSRSPARVFVIHNDLTADQRREIGNERQQFRRWIGSAVPDNARGGYRLMEELYRQVEGREPRIIGITGDPNTPVSTERAQGVQQYVERSGRGKTVQLSHGDWSYADGEQKGRVLLALPRG